MPPTQKSSPFPTLFNFQSLGEFSFFFLFFHSIQIERFNDFLWHHISTISIDQMKTMAKKNNRQNHFEIFSVCVLIPNKYWTISIFINSGRYCVARTSALCFLQIKTVAEKGNVNLLHCPTFFSLALAHSLCLPVSMPFLTFIERDLCAISAFDQI